jgi:hypothetical protein
MSVVVHIELALMTEPADSEPVAFSAATLTSSLLLPIGENRTVRGGTGEIPIDPAMTLADLLAAAIVLAGS